LYNQGYIYYIPLPRGVMIQDGTGKKFKKERKKRKRKKRKREKMNFYAQKGNIKVKV